MSKIAVASAQHWRLWSHDSWRLLAAHSTIFITSIFVYVCAKSLSAQDDPTIILNESSAALAKGGSLFFAGCTLFGYSNFQRENQIRKDNLDLFTAIRMRSDNILYKYGLEPEKHPQLDKLIETIKHSARACFSLRTKDLELIEQLEEANILMNALSKHLEAFISTLPSSLELLRSESLEQEQLFWQRDPEKIKDNLFFNSSHAPT
jgi:hypothetical protein